MATLTTISLGLVLVFLTDGVFVSAVWGHLRWIAPVGLVCSLVVIVAAWTSVNKRPQVSAGLVVIELAILGPVAAAWPHFSASVRGVLVSLAPFAIAGAAQVGLHWSPRTRHPLALSGVYGLTGFAVVISFMGFNPFDEPNCGLVCMDARPLLDGLLTSETVLASAAVSGVAAALVSGFFLIQASSAVPRAVRFSALLGVGCMAAPAVVRWIRWSEPPGAGWVVLLPFLAALAVSCSVLLATLRERQTKRSIQALVEYVADPVGSSPHADSPVARTQFFVPHTGRWVDALGRSAPDDSGEAVVVSDSAGPVVRLFVRPGYRSDDVIDAMTPALRLGVKTSQLMAISRSNLAEVKASRHRIVATSDSERRRIERDLHDGAQQRLVGAMFYLSLAKSRPGTHEDDMARVEEDVGKAIEELRSLAHGVFPSLLSHEGLWAALDELCRSSTVSTDLEIYGADDLGLEPAMATYALVRRALDMTDVGSTATKTSVKCSTGDRLRVTIEIPDPGWNESDWIDVVDRVSAVGGDLVTSSVEGQLIIKADLPCE
jgi:signal transduction histidine kinase